MLLVRHALRRISVSRRLTSSPSPHPSPFDFWACWVRERLKRKRGDEQHPHVTSETVTHESNNKSDVSTNIPEPACHIKIDDTPRPGLKPQVLDGQDYFDVCLAFKSSVTQVQAASEALLNLQLQAVSDSNLLALPRFDIDTGRPSALDDGGVLTERDLEEFLISKLQDNGFRLTERGWHVIPDWDHEGRGDLVFECGSSSCVDLVVEVKYINLAAHGSTASRKRGKKRRHVVEQAIDYAIRWHEKAESRSRSVIAAAYTNEHGLVELAWLLGRKLLGRKVCLLRCTEGDALVKRDLEYVANGLQKAGFKLLEP